jgi:2-aminomuconate deaminase
MSKTKRSGGVVSQRAPEPVGAFPHARRVGNLLFVSGMGPRTRGSRDIPGVELDKDGNIKSYDIAIQCRAVFENVRTVLEDAGSSWDRIVDVTVFLTNMKADFPTFNKLYAEAFADNQPTRTTMEINCLPTPIAVELKVIASIGDSSADLGQVRCPRCHSTTASRQYGDVTVHQCTTCRGIFLHKGELNKVAEPTSGDLEFSTLDLDTFDHEDSYGPIECPECDDVIMKKVEFNIHTNIILDWCKRCGGFWLEKGELDRINEEVRKLNDASGGDSGPAMLWFARFIWSLPR